MKFRLITEDERHGFDPSFPFFMMTGVLLLLAILHLCVVASWLKYELIFKQFYEVIYIASGQFTFQLTEFAYGN